MNDFDNTLTKRKAQMLLDLCGGERIPIKVSSSANGAPGGHQHWMKAVMIGFRGGKVCYRPNNDHGKDEYAPVEKVRLWKSRMSPEMIEKVITVERALGMIKEVDGVMKQAMAADIEKSMSAIPLIPLIEHSEENEKMEQELKKEETLLHVIVEPQPTSPLTFEQKVKERQRLLVEIQSEAGERLKKLYHDREQAWEMLKEIDAEIDQVKKLVEESGVVEVSATKRKGRPPAQVNVPAVSKGVLTYLQVRPDQWVCTTEIRNNIVYTGPKSRFNDVYRPLVTSGQLAKRGSNSHTELRYIAVTPG